MFKSEQHQRRYRRITLEADVLVSNLLGQAMLCRCVEISEDSLELRPLQQRSLFDEFSLKAGDIVQVQLNDLTDAPKLNAAVIKTGRDQIGLRLLNDQ